MPSANATSTESRRRVLAGATGLAMTAVAGCTALGQSDEDARTYRLDGERVDTDSFASYALWTPSDETEWGRQAAATLRAASSGERPTTYGYEPIRADEYVKIDGAYYRTDVVVTGRRQLNRWTLRLRYPDSVPEDATVRGADELSTVDQRAAKIAYFGARARRDGGDVPASVDRGGFVYRPVGDHQFPEDSSLLPAADADYLRFDDRGETLRIEVTREPLREPAYTPVVTRVADSLNELEGVVASTTLDADLDRDALDEEAHGVLRAGVDGDGYEETSPLSDAYERVLDALGLDTDRRYGTKRGYLRSGEEYYRYVFVVDGGG